MQKKASDTQQSTDNDKKTEPHNYNPQSIMGYFSNSQEVRSLSFTYLRHFSGLIYIVMNKN